LRITAGKATATDCLNCQSLLKWQFAMYRLELIGINNYPNLLTPAQRRYNVDVNRQVPAVNSQPRWLAIARRLQWPESRWCRPLTFSEFFSKRALKGRCKGTRRAVLPNCGRPRIIWPKLSPKQQG
jgi:hypothetical protein